MAINFDAMAREWLDGPGDDADARLAALLRRVHEEGYEQGARDMQRRAAVVAKGHVMHCARGACSCHTDIATLPLREKEGTP